MYKITLIPGDGIGPEIAGATRECVDALGLPITWDIQDAGEEAIKKYGTPLPEVLLDSIKKNKVCLKGPITTPIGKGYRSINVSLRKSLNLYVCLRPFKSFQGVRSKYQNIDLVVVRENSEDLYSGIEFEKGGEDTLKLIDFIEKVKKGKILIDSGISIKPISTSASEKITRFAFEYCRKNNRKKVTAVHKANIMKFSDGVFLEAARRISREYPDLEYEERIVDNMCMQLVQKPEKYEVMVLPNLYGDIISDLCAGLIGGLGMAAGANIGEDCSIFEPTHGSAPKYQGKNKVNPSAMILAAVLMLEYLGETKASRRLERALAEVVKEGKSVTYDLKEEGDLLVVGTKEMGEAIIKKLKV
ncbi:MAG: isocitrate dehydrogenase [bacterium (Candidatus Ratteibacteria) CG_4_10_14_3_um_filter_41_18]|uniref:Isocitrate dehydrogenase n=4 Tax=Candidatus Ratteibacteria TaxID=2979319 RepID=A0A2M7YEV0_9BACT|nr:MAG: isocitrate dehydrogenase [Candidatus Omnitrophica bacterium CG1_02_41_171]PIV64377.1 MAG: isocitrate dehydrogenase [bacterium (Candidatus Ratteibacteria) CG01_land_8_20_14_3_00_40_19]PIW33941.1 MAG: isocitrate dehydrogenase [bacterium (Candidatus Ratteibacteria) CG15_BIG_FIL_POST_REV_8_21_14_020_41_12]PIW74383.1 MAG: isocitrate dehydrogenase [bacterium (Candidatus Ratteibacteria) CG_4_8_14_3_um_filter_41_36]PIX77720.1 MAG: isocitrate dehydrogenase [bacterium (Candidatus Ratteibacteria) 